MMGQKNTLWFFPMCVVDSLFAYVNIASRDNKNQENFYMLLSEEMVANCDDSTRGDRRTRRSYEDPTASWIFVGEYGKPKDSIGVHVTPMKKGKNTSGKYTIQLRCRVCSEWTASQCS